MEKKDNSYNSLYLMQMIKSLEEAGTKLEESYKTRDYDRFNKSKKMLLEIQKKVEEILG